MRTAIVSEHSLDGPFRKPTSKDTKRSSRSKLQHQKRLLDPKQRKKSPSSSSLSAVVSPLCIGARLSWLSQVRMIVRNDFRQLFGSDVYFKRGHFVEYGMTLIIHRYTDWFDYTIGDCTLEGHRGYVMASVVSDDGRHLYTGSYDKSIIQWDLVNGGAMAQRWPAHDKTIRCLDFRREQLVSASNDGTLRVWQAYSKRLQHELVGHTDAVTSAKFNQSGSLIVSCSDDTSLRLWSAKDGSCVSVFTEHSASVRSAFFVQDSIISASEDKSIRVWTPYTSECEISLTNIKSTDVFGVVMNCDHTLIAYNCFKIKLFSWPSLEQIDGVNEYSISVRFHPLNPAVLAVGTCDDESVKLFNVTKGELIRKFVGHSDTVRDLCFTKDGSKLISVSDDTSVRVWDLTDLPI